MERKSAISFSANGPLMLITALLSILVYHVVFGQQAVKADFVPAAAGQAPTGGTDKGPKWTVTPVMWGDATKQYLCVIKEGEKDAVGIRNGRTDLATDPTYMAIYQLRSNGLGVDVELVANRQVNYDLRLPVSITGAGGKPANPFEVERKFSEFEKELADKEKERAEKEKEKEKKDK